MPNCQLETLLSSVSHRVLPCGSAIEKTQIKDIVYNSKKADSDTLFVCMEGAVSDGHAYALDAYARGCRAFVVSHEIDLPNDAAQILVDSPRETLADLSAAFFEHPERSLRVIGVTGTKGKSTVCEMIRHILNRAGIPTGSIGTIGVRYGDVCRPTQNTTPESYDLYRAFAEMKQAGIFAVAMEVSSQGLKCGRVRGIPFYAAVMTNLSPDHIGPLEHPDFDDYRACKMKLFHRAESCFLNADDRSFPVFRENAAGQVHTYSLCGDADLSATDLTPVCEGDRFGIAFSVRENGTSARGYLPMPGQFSVYNALAAIGVCRLFGIPLATSLSSLATVAVNGRFERVDVGMPNVSFLIDYAHNGESLRSALAALRDYRPKRLICLFGAVGERTKLRRHEMGAAASAFADFCILTDDNPGKEPSMQIIEEIAQALVCPYIAIPDRTEAIAYAVAHAEDGDIVLLAGKGHETYQAIDGKHVPFSEREALIAAAKKRKESPVF